MILSKLLVIIQAIGLTELTRVSVYVLLTFRTRTLLCAGQSIPRSAPMWADVDARSTHGSRLQFLTRQDGDQDDDEKLDSQWQRLEGPVHRLTGEDNDATSLSRLKDYPIRDAQFLHQKINVGMPPEYNAFGEKLDEFRMKQAGPGQGPYSGSMGVFAYPGTPQRGQTNPPAAGIAIGSPGYERTSITHTAATKASGTVCSSYPQVLTSNYIVNY